MWKPAIAADILIAFAGECFTEEIEDTESLKYCRNWSQFVSTRHDSGKPEKVNISILSGCCRLSTLRHHSTFQVKILNLFYFIYFQKSEFTGSAFRYHENSDPETHTPGNNKEKRFKTYSSQSYHPNFLRSRNVHRQKQPERIEIFFFSGLSLSRLVDTKLTSIWTTL